MFEALVEDVVTRWDSELDLLVRLTYFDNEILLLYGIPELGIPRDLMLDRFEFDLALGMTFVLEPLRIFTKEVQHRSKVTLAYIPQNLDRLITQLAPGSFFTRLLGRSEGVLPLVEAFQSALTSSIRKRFGWIFEKRSLPLAAAYLLPGPNRLSFANFEVNDEVKESIKAQILDDLLSLLPISWTAEQKERRRRTADATLSEARADLDGVADTTDPLSWWPQQAALGTLFDVARMYLAIPASTADDERVFSSAGFTLNARRTRLDLDNFRREHRVRQFVASGTSLNEQAGRNRRLELTRTLMQQVGALQLQRQRPDE